MPSGESEMARRSRPPEVEAILVGFDRLAALDRRLERLEAERSLQEFLAAGGNIN